MAKGGFELLGLGEELNQVLKDLGGHYAQLYRLGY
jgi:hypothetical protein